MMRNFHCISDESLNMVTNFSFLETFDRKDPEEERASSHKLQTVVPHDDDDVDGLHSMMNMMIEPTPIGPQDSVTVVPTLSSLTTFGNNDDDNALFLESLRNLLKKDQQLQQQQDEEDSFLLKYSLPFEVTDDDRSSTSSTTVNLESAINHIVGPSPSSSSSSSSSTSSLRSSHMEQWHQRYLELVEFQQVNGHCLVPLNYQANPSLAHWVKRQRYQYRMKHRDHKHSTLTKEREAMLQELGFVWDSHAAGWEERLGELKDFKLRYGHCNVPKKYPENQQLSVWVKCQRRQYKLLKTTPTPSSSTTIKSNMTNERIAKLLQLGFVFDPRSKKKRLSIIDYQQQQHF